MVVLVTTLSSTRQLPLIGTIKINVVVIFHHPKFTGCTVYKGRESPHCYNAMFMRSLRVKVEILCKAKDMFL